MLRIFSFSILSIIYLIIYHIISCYIILYHVMYYIVSYHILYHILPYRYVYIPFKILFAITYIQCLRKIHYVCRLWVISVLCHICIVGVFCVTYCAAGLHSGSLDLRSTGLECRYDILLLCIWPSWSLWEVDSHWDAITNLNQMFTHSCSYFLHPKKSSDDLCFDSGVLQTRVFWSEC